jgi:hypothetical protein
MKDADRVLVTRRRLLQGGALVVSGLACARRAWSPAWGEVAGTSGTEFSIGNDLIERTLSFEPETGLSTRSLMSESTHANYILPGSAAKSRAQEFSFVCNGQACSGTNATFGLLDSSETAQPSGKSCTVRLRHKQLPLEVDAVYTVYNGHAAIRKHLVLRNTGASPLHFSHLNIEALGIALGPANETTLLTQYGTTPRETFYTGRSEDAGLLVANGLTGQGIAVIS